MLLNLNDRSAWPLVTTGYRHHVYVRYRWSDPWTRRDDLHCEQAVWATAPELPTATLNYRYGRVRVPGSNQYQHLTPIAIRGWWVCIRFACDDGTLDWYGYAESPITQDHQPATPTEPATGVQIIPCYGLDRALQLTHVHDGVWSDADENTHRGGSPLVFGEHRRAGQRADDPDATGGNAYPFAADDDGAEDWTHRDVLEHLVEFHSPRAGGTGIDWQTSALAVVPSIPWDWLDTDGLSLYDAIGHLCGRDQMLGWSVAPPLYSAPAAAAASPPPGVPICVVPHSLSTAPIVSAGKIVALPALRQWDIVCDRDPYTTVTPSESSLDIVDQVIIVGGRRVSVCTLDRAKDGEDAELENDWTEENLAAYNAGASADEAYADAHPLEQERMDAAARSGTLLSRVFRQFRLPKKWTFRAGDKAVFPTDYRTPAGESHKPFPAALRLLSALPLDDATDYSQPAEQWRGKTPARAERPLLVALQVPRFAGDPEPSEAEKRFEPIHLIGGAEQLPSRKHPVHVSLRSYVLQPTHSQPSRLVVEVEGLPQHIIGGQDFEPNDADKDKDTPNNEYDYKTMRATVAIEEDRRVTAAWPPALPPIDVVRRRVIHVPQYGATYIVPDTIVDYDPEGKPTKSPGGFARDDTPQMQLLARRLAAYHTQPRRSATLHTRRMISQLRVGDLVRSVSGASGPVNAPISRIEIRSPLGINGQPAPAPTQSIAITAVPIDIERLLGIR